MVKRFVAPSGRGMTVARWETMNQLSTHMYIYIYIYLCIYNIYIFFEYLCCFKYIQTSCQDVDIQGTTRPFVHTKMYNNLHVFN